MNIEHSTYGVSFIMAKLATVVINFLAMTADSMWLKTEQARHKQKRMLKFTKTRYEIPSKLLLHGRVSQRF